MRRWTYLVATLVALVPAAPAAAAPVDLGAGANPSVVVDAAGTAHIVFKVDGGQTYCRLPRNAGACDVRTFLPGVGEALDERPAILQRGDGVLVIVESNRDRIPDTELRGTTYLRVSGDGGATWQGPTPIAAGSFDFSAVALAPDGASVFTLGPDTGRLDVQHAPFAGGTTRTVNLVGNESPGDDARMAVLADGRIVVLDDNALDVQWRVFGGGDVYDINTWGARGILKGMWDTEVVSGPRGTFLLDHRALGDQRTGGFAAPFSLRSLDTRRLRWRAARTAGADRSIFGSSSLFQDARGRLHIIADTGGAGRTTCVLYTRTGTRSSDWFGPTTVLFRTNDGARTPQRVRVAAGADGRGVAVWQDSGPTGQAGNVWATPLRQARGQYRPRADQNDRPACVGSTYS